MNWFEQYIAYYKDNPKGYWFKRKHYGWGWVPVKWQGWLFLGIYVAAVILFGATIDKNSPPDEIVFTFFLPVFLLTVALIRICYRQGEKPRWQWGFPKEENSNETE